MCQTIVSALDSGQSSHLSGGQRPSCMTSMRWTGWSTQRSRACTLPNPCPVSQTSLRCVSRYITFTPGTMQFASIFITEHQESELYQPKPSLFQPEPEFRPPMSEVVQALVRLVQRANMTRRMIDGEEGSRRPDDQDQEFV